MKVNLAEKFSKITEYWKPYVAAELNGQMVKLDKIKGEFVFHHHDHEDELFLVVKGRFRMEFNDRPHEWIEEGEFIVVPRGRRTQARRRRRMLVPAVRAGWHFEYRECGQRADAPRARASLRAVARISGQ